MARPPTTTRDHTDLHHRLEAWLGTKVEGAKISELVVPQSSGMSSETVLFDAHWEEGGATRTQSCACRIPPDPDAVPVFPHYDLERQFRAMRLVAEHTDVPVPETLWLELDESFIGAPFFVMKQVEGRVPPDVMPYTYGSWLTEATEEERRALQDASVAVVARVHTIDVAPAELAFLELDRPGDTPLRRHVADTRAFYDWVAADGVRSPLLERAFDWLDRHWPAEEGPTALSWGDSRPGNIMYRGFEPVAVLDWEMAAVGPPEIDLGWMIFLHRFFQDMTEQSGLPGLPDFMRRDAVAATYESLTGYGARDLEFFLLYAAVRHGVVMFRIARRSMYFGEAEMPADPDDLVMHRTTIEAMLDGSYWSRL